MRKTLPISYTLSMPPTMSLFKYSSREILSLKSSLRALKWVTNGLAEVAADYKEVQKVTARQEEVRAEIEALYAEYETLI